MRKKTRLTGILAIIIGLLFFGGLLYIIFSTMNKYSRISAQSDAVIYRQGSTTILATVVKKFNAHSVTKGGGTTSVSGSTTYYACGYDIAHGEKRWEVKLNARNGSGKNWGDAVLLGQSDKYLFFLRNELYVISKESGELIARNKDLKGLEGKTMNESSIFPAFINNYVYDDSLHAVVIKGADGLAYLLDENTLVARPASNIHAISYFRQQQERHRKAAISTYQEQLVTLTKADGQLFAFMDDNDYELLQEGMALPYGALEAPRRFLYTTQQDTAIVSLNKINNKVFLYGGFLKAPGQDSNLFSVKEPEFYKAANQLLSRGNHQQNIPLRLPGGGYLVLHKATVAQHAPLLLTAIAADGDKLWHVATRLTGISQVRRAGNQLYILGADHGGRSGDADHILLISLSDGRTIDYNIRSDKTE
ncbi:PA2928 family protein [Chitinophaga rhizophila]|uniref:Uncharacterized protein n=1 Tax=Chitinophaga rhizophila TaxID=2866212 RepID=A0ABS7G904_9BACT|nr:PA2928 family protein [Chitinophaga rhizophila]MBW8684153.1 hypothetical protein [Chitinophaga rhizophila]